MSFCLKNLNITTHVDVLIKSGKITILPGQIAGPFPDSEETGDVKIKCSRREIAKLIESKKVIIQSPAEKVEPEIIDDDDKNVLNLEDNDNDL